MSETERQPEPGIVIKLVEDRRFGFVGRDRFDGPVPNLVEITRVAYPAC